MSEKIQSNSSVNIDSLKEKYDFVGEFVDGVAVVESNGTWFHIKEDGSRAYDAWYDDASDFIDGMALVTTIDRSHYIRPDGTRVHSEDAYDSIGFFSEEGLARAHKDGVHFHVTPDGSPAYEATFDHVDDFVNGFAVAFKDGESFHIKPDGSPAYDARFDRVTPYKEREGLVYAKAYTGDVYSFIDTNGQKFEGFEDNSVTFESSDTEEKLLEKMVPGYVPRLTSDLGEADLYVKE